MEDFIPGVGHFKFIVINLALLPQSGEELLPGLRAAIKLRRRFALNILAIKFKLLFRKGVEEIYKAVVEAGDDERKRNLLPKGLGLLFLAGTGPGKGHGLDQIAGGNQADKNPLHIHHR